MTRPIPDRVARLRQYINEDRIILGAWTSEKEGRHYACLLAALVPECGEAMSPNACPAEVMPAWLAHLTPDLNDYVSAGAWASTVERYATCASGWHRLDEAAWERVRKAHLLGCLTIARESTKDEEWRFIPVMEETERLLRESGTDQERITARASAWAAARAAAVFAAEMAEATEELAAFAKEAAWDRIADTLLSSLEAEIQKAS